MMDKYNKNSGQFGEYAVASELSRFSLTATTFTRNMPDYDILAINRSNKLIKIQVKTISRGEWSLNANRFLDFDESLFEKGMQKILSKKQNVNVHFIVFVKMNESRGKDDFYILPYPDLVNIIYNNYNIFLKSKDYKRPKNPFTTHTGLKPQDIVLYKDKWDLIVNFK